MPRSRLGLRIEQIFAGVPERGVWLHPRIAAVHRAAAIVATLRVGVLLSTVVSAAVLVPAQMHEALRALAENWGAGLRTPAVLTLTAVMLFAVIAWYWSRVLLYLLKPGATRAAGVEGAAARWLPRLCAVLPIAAVALALLLAARPLGGGEMAAEAAEVRRRLQAWGVLMLALAALTMLVLARRRTLLRRLRRWRLQRRHDAPGGGRAATTGGAPRLHRPAPVDPRPRAYERAWRVPGLEPGAPLRTLRELDGTTRLMLALSAVPGVACLLLFALGGVQPARLAGTVAILFVGLGVWLPIGSTLVYAARWTGVPWTGVLLALAVLLAGFGLNDNHRVRTLPGAPPAAPPVSDAFREWLAARPDAAAYEVYPVVLIAAEGGGIRAAYQAAAVLAALQDRCPAFAMHAFAISGVSGGSVGAAVFAASVARHPPAPAGAPCVAAPADTFAAIADGVLASDFLAPVAAALLFPDLFQRFVPMVPLADLSGRWDRARALEQSLERAWHAHTGDAAMATDLHALWHAPGGAARSSVPSLLLNTTRVETGERAVVSNLGALDARPGGVRMLHELHPDARLRLSTAAALSARFPGVTPSGHLRVGRGGKHRYVDGGYFEATGTATLTNVLASLDAAVAAGGVRPFRPIVIQIRYDDAAGADTLGRTKFTGEAFEELLSPVRTLLNTRAERGRVAAAQLRFLVGEARGSRCAGVVLEYVFRDEGVPLPLGWQLAAATRREMKAQLAARRDAPTPSRGAMAETTDSVATLLAAARGTAPALC